MDKRLIEILKYLQKKYGEEEGLKLFEIINDQTMITVEQVTKDLKSEIRLTKWIITIGIAILGLLLAIIAIK